MSRPPGYSIAPLLVAALFALNSHASAQNPPEPPVIGDVFSTNSQAYYDQFSSDCSRGNTSPYAGMDPLVCHGVMMPTDSRGACSGARGWQLLKQESSTCYFCVPLSPPIDGVIIPIDQLNQARLEGFKCGVDQADPNCMAVCTRFAGSGSYLPPGNSVMQPTPEQSPLASNAGPDRCIPPDSLSPEERASWYQTYILSGRIRCPGAYNPCDNPDAPSWCPNQTQLPATNCGCSDPANPATCDDRQSLGQRFCLRGYSAEEILCGDPDKFPRGTLLRGRPVSPQQQLADWMLTPEAESFSNSVTGMVTRRVIIPRSMRPHKGYMVGLQATLLVTVTKCGNGAAKITNVQFVSGLARGIQQNSTGQYVFVNLQQKPPYFDWYMQNALNGSSSLIGTNVALPDTCPTNEVGISLYLKNWDAHLWPGLPVAIP